MARIKDKYDIVIIGSGLGGLQCGYVLAKEGYKVCILEKNAQIGGNLQTFKRDRIKFDSGVHYVGGLEKGQPLYRYFKYFNLLNTISLEKLDEDGYDRISFSGDPVSYPHAQGFENFIQQLLVHFPNEEKGLRKYIEEIIQTCSHFELYNLDKTVSKGNEIDLFSISAKEVIESCTSNKKLQSVLAGSNMLYAGFGATAPFYIHALIINSYVNSSYKLGYSDQISTVLRKEIRAFGGEIHINAEVVSIQNNAKNIEHIELASGKTVGADIYISNIHPTLTFQMLQTESLRKANVNRMLNLKNTISAFIVYIKLKPESLAYCNYNRYHFYQNDVWNLHQYTEENWIKGIALFNSPEKSNPAFANSLTAMVYMKHEEVEQWSKTYNTTLSESNRDEMYVAFKEEKAQRVLTAIEEVVPDIRRHVETYYTATPLTQRDYIGSVDGGIYGIEHSYNNPLESFLSSNTKLSNLFLTGQNVVLHGVLGVTVGSMVTCQQILGKEYLMEKVMKASNG